MNTNTTTVKTAAKTAAKTVSKPLTEEQKAARSAKAQATKAANAYSFATLATSTIMGFLAQGSAFYGRALTYHASKGTTFPRARNAGEIERLKALPEAAARKEVDEIKRQHDARILAAGSKTAQAMFDLFMAARAK